MHAHFRDTDCRQNTNQEATHAAFLQQGIDEGRRQAEEEMPEVVLMHDPTRPTPWRDEKNSIGFYILKLSFDYFWSLMNGI